MMEDLAASVKEIVGASIEPRIGPGGAGARGRRRAYFAGLVYANSDSLTCHMIS
jgi:hypothetical protein